MRNEIGIRKKIRIDMSVEIDVLIGSIIPKFEIEEYINSVARNYVKCLGDKDIIIERVELYDNN